MISPALFVLVDSLASGAAVLAAAGVIAWILRRRSASMRHLVWLMAMLSLVLLPIVTAIGPHWQMQVLPAPQRFADAPPATVLLTPQKVPDEALPDIQPFRIPGAGEIPAPRITATPSLARAAGDVRSPGARVSVPLQAWPLVIWFAGVVVVLTQLAIGMAIAAWRRHLSVPLDGTGQTVPVLVSERCMMPMATGLLRPAILLPAESRHWTADKLRMVLLHELAHVRRFDCLSQVVAHLGLALHWCDPLAWLAMRRLAVERELACDDVVLSSGAVGSAYAGYLLEVARTLHARCMAAAVPMARSSHLEKRLLAIFDTARPRRAVTRPTLLIAIALALVLLFPLAGLRLGRAQARPPATATTEYTPIGPQTAATSSVTCLVKDEAGRPLDRIVVRAMHEDQAAVQRRTATTNADGRCAFDKLAEGYWNFSVDDARFAWEWDYEQFIQVPAEPSNLPVVLTLDHPRTLHATVVDDGGKPVAGVRVALVSQLLPHADRRTWDHMDHEFMATRTDDAGRFTMTRLRPGETDLVLEHPGFAITLVQLEVSDQPQTLTIHTGLTLHGRVMHDGKPLTNVKLSCGMNEDHHPVIDWHGQSDADGRFEIQHIPPRDKADWSRVEAVDVVMDDPAWMPMTYQVYQTGEHQLPEITIETKPRVKDAQDHWEWAEAGSAGAAAGGTVRVMLPGLRGDPMVMLSGKPLTSPPLDRRATTEPVVFTDVPPGEYRVEALAFTTGDPGRLAKSITVAAGKTVDVTLEPGSCEIRGTVRSGGKIVPGGPHTWVSWFKYPPGASGVGVFQGGINVQADGTYSAKGLVPGEYELIWEGPGSMLNITMAKVDAAEPTLCDIDLPTGRIDGRLIGVEPRPGPVPEVGTIWVWPRGLAAHLPRSSGCMLNPGPDGRFAIEHLSPGWYTIAGYGLADTVQIDGPGAVATATLQPADQTGEIAGTVSGHLPPNIGQSFNAVYVNAFPKDALGYNFHDWHQATLNPRTGRYQISKLAAGTYGVTVTGGPPLAELTGCVWLPDIEVRAGLSRDLPIVLPLGRAVRITTADRRPPYGPIPACSGWELQMPGGDWLDENVFGPEMCLPPGQYTIRAAYGVHNQIVSQRFNIELGAGEQQVMVDGPKLAGQ